jgi:D-glycero-alpha-D-manno-heptose-7-phosphate kinase
MSIREILEQNSVEASAPCRIDMGGTLDLSTFFYPLQRLHPCTFNAALDLRTRVRVSPFDTGKVKISSHGFEDLVVESALAPYDHPLGLMLAVAAHFHADGVHIEIHSSSPPRSALGGSSVAAVALIWAFSKALAEKGHPMPKRSSVVMLAHAIEQSVAGVPCGMQDQLAAVYGGVNAWHWLTRPPDLPFRRQSLASVDGCKEFERHLLVAYCGRPHVSKDVNATWVKQFVSGLNRRQWHEIVDCSHKFVSALEAGDYRRAKTMMNQETDIRCELTPEVLDKLGAQLVAAARERGCGARFTGAGGGGCLWALGAPDDIKKLRPVWEDILIQRSTAQLLNAGIDTVGLL